MKVDTKENTCYAQKFRLTRRLKSFPWDALVYASIMKFYLKLEKLGKSGRCVMLWVSISRLSLRVGLMCLTEVVARMKQGLPV